MQDGNKSFGSHHKRNKVDMLNM